VFVDKDQQYEFQLQLDATADPQLTSRTLDSTPHMGVSCGGEREGGQKGTRISINKTYMDERKECWSLSRGVMAKRSPRVCQGEFRITHAPLGYPLSVFIKIPLSI